MQNQPIKKQMSLMDLMNCAICLSPCVNPKILPCVHSFCFQCISDYIQSCSAARVNKGFNCPVCREFVPAADPNSPPAEWAQKLKANFMMKELMNVIRPDTNLDNNEVLCAQHGAKLDLVCVDCETVPVCASCIAVSHRMCRQVCTLSQAADEKRETILFTLTGVEERLQRVKSRERELKKEECLLEAQKKEITKEITEVMAGLQKTLTDEFTRMKAKLESSCKEASSYLTRDMDKIVKSKENLEQASKQGREILDKSDLETIGQFHKIKLRFSEILNERLDSIPANIPSFRLDFKIDPALTKYKDLSFGEITTEKSLRNVHFELPQRRISDVSQLSNSDFEGLSLTVEPTSPTERKTIAVCNSPLMKASIRVTHIKKVEAKIKGDKAIPALRDVTIVSGNVIVVTDGDNNVVKSFYTQGPRLQFSRYDTTHTPHGITCVAGNTVLVLIPKKKEMLMLNVTPNIFFQKKVTTAKRYWAVSTLSPDSFAVSTCPGYGPPSIDIINLEGTLVKVISTGVNLFSNPMYMCTMPDGNIVISDPTVPCLVCLRQNGYIVFKYDHKKSGEFALKSPHGVSADKNGAILVADEHNSSILLISPDGQPLRKVITKSDSLNSKPKGVMVGERGFLATIHEEKINTFLIS